MELQPWHIIIMVIVMAGVLALWISAVVSIARHPDASPTARVIWIVVVLLFPLLGSAIWFVTGRSSLRTRPELT